MKDYTFSVDELNDIHMIMLLGGEFSPRPAFKYFFRLSESSSIPTEDIEDFTIAFMSQYNKLYPGTW